MKHIILGYILLIFLPTLYWFQMRKLTKPFENKLGVVVFSSMGFGQVFIGISNLSSEGTRITTETSYIILGVAFLILCVGTIITLKNKGKKAF